MAILDLPILSRRNATKCTLSLVPNTQFFESPLTKSAQTYELPGARWMFTATWENLAETDARIIKAWLAKLRGAAGRFYGYDLSRKTVAGQALYDGAVTGGNQTGRNIIATWTPPELTVDSTLYTSDDDSITVDLDYYLSNRWLLPGDYVSIGGELKMITDITPLEGGGLASVAFEPPLRQSPTNGSVVAITAPRAVFRLVDDKQDQIGFDPQRRCSITIQGIEVFR